MDGVVSVKKIPNVIPPNETKRTFVLFYVACPDWLGRGQPQRDPDGRDGVVLVANHAIPLQTIQNIVMIALVVGK